MKNTRKKAVAFCLSTVAWMFVLSGCANSQGEPINLDGIENVEPAVIQIDEVETVATTKEAELLIPLSPDGPVLPVVEGVEAEFSEPIPDYIRVGMEHPIVAQIQAQLMKLGFMDNDEPTNFFGEVTQEAVKIYQRQNDLAQDGIVGPETLEAILSPEAKYYAAQEGDQGSDIQRIQSRLYELGYLASADLLTGNFGETTLEAVKMMQEANDLTVDGKVGRQSMNLLYSDEIKPNMLAYGDKSELVLAAQERLNALGYMVSVPDGVYGSDTVLAVKQFQSRNDQIVDGYLGPSTRIALNSADAVPNGVKLGDEGESVQSIQKLLQKYGYLNASHVTGYFGEITENAVKLFQRTNGLSADGSVGTLTMGKLTSGSAVSAPAGTTPSTGGSSSSSGSTGGSTGSSSSGGSTGSSVPSTGGATSGSSVDALISVASSKIGSPYVWGAKGPSSFDCSGFVYWCLNQVGVSQSYITSSGWRSVGKYQKVSNYSDLRAGDIIVVSGHVGIVTYDGAVIDASSGNGKVVHRSLSSWWQQNFIVGWRIF